MSGKQTALRPAMREAAGFPQTSASHQAATLAIDKADAESRRSANAQKATFAAELLALEGCRKGLLRWVDQPLARGTKRGNSSRVKGLS